tara:strand:- start:27671 stop:28093 length:423 start_codon:yes stop_codon:yes gene_type:complete
MDGEDKEEEFSLPSASIESEDHSDVDPFEELGIGSRVNATSTEEDGRRGYDALSDLVDDDGDLPDSDVAHGGLLEEDGFETKSSNENDVSKAEATYVMLLQTVWVDGILDPAEVRLLAKKRSELGISFERHLKLVDDLLG